MILLADDSEPVPGMFTVTVAGDVQPLWLIVLPDNVRHVVPDITRESATIVMLGVAPEPVYAKFTVSWLLPEMLKPVTETFATWLDAPKTSPPCPPKPPRPHRSPALVVAGSLVVLF